MKKLSGNEIRQMFLDFFKSKGFMIEPSASLIPHNDPTLLWINAGVSTLKKYFDGSLKPACPRIANAQKCIRTNDIENVGKTARHHTFFEMLGNFSIGDYFKKEAITWAWEFLTSEKWIGFDPKRLYVTVYPDDEETYNLWIKTGMLESHISRNPDNFWEIGRGPGGPDTEIYYDRGRKYDPLNIGEKLFFDDIENDRYVELWNIVFSQYDCRPGEVPRSEYKELPQKNIDTGMGLERLVCFLQDGETNFDTDLFLPIIKATETYAKHNYGENEYKMSYRVIADHIRTVTFALADGALFSNEGRGYVLRRVLRRAVRYGIKLGIEGPFMYKLVKVCALNMEAYYPYLKEKVDLVSKLVLNEEESFHKTLNTGEALLKEQLNKHKDNKTLPGEIVFKLYDTYGFPKELTEEIANENGYSVDLKGYKEAMDLQKERARAARTNEQSMHSQSKDLMDFTLESEFTGYDEISTVGKVIGLFKDGTQVKSLSEEGDIILSKTCFYAESGGQCCDVGKVYNENFKADVTSVIKAPHKQALHHIENVKGTIKIGDYLTSEYDYDKRLLTRANHSSLHLLQEALKEVLGDHIAQAGSYNCPLYARFDFTHFEKPSEEQLNKVERLVNEMINASYPVISEVMPIEEAKKTKATALFDEKYGDMVRVVTMGPSKEFCGGTHALNTSELGCFKIISEESIGSGVRRIQSVTKMAAYTALKDNENKLKGLRDDLKLKNVDMLASKIDQMKQKIASLEEDRAQLLLRTMNLDSDAAISKAKENDQFKYCILKVNDLQYNAKDYANTIKNKIDGGAVFIANITNGKYLFVCSLGNKAMECGFDALKIVKDASALCLGKGGGKKDLAQSGGINNGSIDMIIEKVKEIFNK